MIDAPLQIELPTAPGESGPVRCIVGPENELLVPVLSRLLAVEPLPAAAEAFNPLVLTGPSGAGKSMLAQAAVRRFTQRYGVERTHYFTAADFCRQLQDAAENSHEREFVERLQGAALVVVEELDRLRPRHPGQWSLRSLVESLVAAGGCVLVTARQPLASLPQLDAGLRDRLGAGLSLALNWPGEETRRAILAAAASRRGISVSAEEIERIASKTAGPAHKLAGALSRQAAATIAGKDSAPLLDAVETPGLKQIVAVVARYFQVTQGALTSPVRRKSLVHARCVAAYLARRLARSSYAEIGRALGGRDHTTIIHAESRIQELLSHDAATIDAVDKLTRILQAT